MICLLASWTGCGKRPDASPAPGESSAATVAAPANPSATVSPQSASDSDAAQIAALVKELTQAVRKYSVEQRRVPKNLEELVANGYLISVPPAPAEKKFAIDKNLQVNLVNR